MRHGYSPWNEIDGWFLGLTRLSGVRSRGKNPRGEPTIPMYTVYMALHINNSDVELKVRRMAALTGESITDAIGNAADERIKRRISSVAGHVPSVDAVLELVQSFGLRRMNVGLTEEEILGFGPDGISQ